MKKLINTALALLLTVASCSPVLAQPPAYNDEYLLLLDAAIPADLRTEQRPAVFEALKKRILANLPAGFSNSRRLSHLPMTVLQTSDPRVLEALSKEPGVLAVYPNRKLSARLAQSLPLIHQLYPAAAG